MGSDAVVHVVDDDLAVRRSLAFLFASDGVPVRVHETASAFLDNVAQAEIGCILTDVRMPGIDGLEFISRLKARGFQLPVIVMTGHADIALAVEAMKTGAVDFIEKPFDDQRLLSAVRHALERQTRALESGDQGAAAKMRLNSLSERELQVLDGLVAGKANKAIAFELGLSSRTVEVHRANLMTKMQARSLSELVRMSFLVGAPHKAP